MNIDALKVGLAPAEVPTPETAPAAPVAAPAPAPAVKPAPTVPAAPSGPTQAELEAAAARRRREQEEARRRDEAAAAQEAAAQEAGPPMPELVSYMQETSPEVSYAKTYVDTYKGPTGALKYMSDVFSGDVGAVTELAKQYQVMQKDAYDKSLYSRANSKANLMKMVPAPAVIPKNIKNKELFITAHKAKVANSVIDRANTLASLGAGSADIAASFAGTFPNTPQADIQRTLDILTLPKLARLPESRPIQEDTKEFYGNIGLPKLTPMTETPTRDTRTPAEMQSDFEEFRDSGMSPTLSLADQLQSYYDTAVERSIKLGADVRALGPAGKFTQKEVRIPVPDKQLMPDEDLVKYYDPQTANMMKSARDRGETELVYTQAIATSAN